MLLTIPPFVVKKLIVLIINSLENEHKVHSYAREHLGFVYFFSRTHPGTLF